MRNCILISILAGAIVARIHSHAEPPVSGSDTNAATAIYDPDPNHLWNRVFATFYRQHLEVRFTGSTNGTSFATNPPPKELWIGPDVLDPPILKDPDFLADNKEFLRCNAVLEEFLQQHGEKLIRDPLKRAVFQRDLWAVFDIVQSGENASWASRQKRRVTMGRNLAQIMSAVALSYAEIEALPNTFRDAVASGAFSPEPKRGQYNFLPADFFEPDSGWIETSSTRISTHSQFVKQRSVFRVFIKAPAEVASKWRRRVEETRQLREQYIKTTATILDPPLKLEPGIQFLLLREMLCLDTDGLVRPTHIVESVQMRGAAGEGTNLLRYARELELNRQLLFQHSQGGLKPTVRDELRPEGYATLGGIQEVKYLPVRPFTQTCSGCHSEPEPRLFSNGLTIAHTPNEGGFQTISQKVTRADFIQLREWMGKKETPER